MDDYNIYEATMNTPSPCIKCTHLYADCMQEDDPNYAAECKLGLKMGQEDCIEFKPYREESRRCPLNW